MNGLAPDSSNVCAAETYLHKLPQLMGVSPEVVAALPAPASANHEASRTTTPQSQKDTCQHPGCKP